MSSRSRFNAASADEKVKIVDSHLADGVTNAEAKAYLVKYASGDIDVQASGLEALTKKAGITNCRMLDIVGGAPPAE